jgi:hypothetical protein
LEKAEYKPYWPFNERDKEKTIGDRARAPRCKCSECGRIDAMTEKYIPATFSDYDNIDPNNTGELSDHQYMLCMSHMSGFILKDRVYGGFT